VKLKLLRSYRRHNQKRVRLFVRFGPTSRDIQVVRVGVCQAIKVTVTLLTVPVTPETLIVEGYGAAAPLVVAGAPLGIVRCAGTV